LIKKNFVGLIKHQNNKKQIGLLIGERLINIMHALIGEKINK
jgi:hypothetical protein